MQNRRHDFSNHILPTAANLVGVCMMAISVVKLLPRQGWTGAIDEILASASVFFLISVGLSYASLRVERHAARLERWAEIVFLYGLVVVIVAASVLAYAIN